MLDKLEHEIEILNENISSLYVKESLELDIKVDDLNILSRKELLNRCFELGITKYKSKNKKELIKLIHENQKNHNKYILDIKNIDGITYLSTIENNSIDLILADPPYGISKKSGMDEHYNIIKMNEENGLTYIKTDEDWEIYKRNKNILDDKNKENYKKFGTTYGKKYAIPTKYGKWDEEFPIEVLEQFIKEFYKKLKKGGTLIIFYDLWKITVLKNLMEKYKFKQLRFIEWIKTNPQPRNSKINYMTNCREIALVGIKISNPTFNSSHDNGIYMYPIQSNKSMIHPTKKNLKLFEELIKKHTNENDIVLDTFLGSGTTAVACKNTKRYFKGCEIDNNYYDKIKNRLENELIYIN